MPKLNDVAMPGVVKAALPHRNVDLTGENGGRSDIFWYNIWFFPKIVMGVGEKHTMNSTWRVYFSIVNHNFPEHSCFNWEKDGKPWIVGILYPISKQNKIHT